MNAYSAWSHAMRWIATSDDLPSEEVLVLVDDGYHVAVLVEEDSESGAAFMDVHSSDLLPWPTHWMRLPPPPAHADRALPRACRPEIDL